MSRVCWQLGLPLPGSRPGQADFFGRTTCPWLPQPSPGEDGDKNQLRFLWLEISGIFEFQYAPGTTSHTYPVGRVFKRSMDPLPPIPRIARRVVPGSGRFKTLQTRSIGSGPLSDPVIMVMAKLVDDGMAETKREPTHSQLEGAFRRAGLSMADPNRVGHGRPLGKAKRVREVLSWAFEHNLAAGRRLVFILTSTIQALGGFRRTSVNFVGHDVISNARAVFRNDGYDLGGDGTLRVLLLDGLSGRATTDALRNYVNRAKRGADDAALVTGTGKDLLEATAKHVLVERFGQAPHTASFPTLLGQAFTVAGLSHEWKPGGSPQARVESALYELGCAVNALRNKEGTGHGRPFLPTVTAAQARAAIESMGIIAEMLLAALEDGMP